MSPFRHPVGRSLVTFIVASAAVLGARSVPLARGSDLGRIPDPDGRREVAWPTADGVGGAHASPLNDIDKLNVRSLEVAWVYRTGDVGDGTDGRAGTAFEATPIVTDGTLYVTTPYSRVIALDAETGTERWTFDPGLDRSSRNHKMTTSRGLASWLDGTRAQGEPCRRRILATSYDARLFALDAEHGTPCPDFGRGPCARRRRAHPCMPEHHYELARLYHELGDAAGAAREIGHALALPPRGDYDRSVLAKAHRLLPADRAARARPSY